MKECCKPAIENKPNPIAKWARMALFIVIAAIVLVAALSQFKLLNLN
jgi:hypothetical protein